MHPETTHAQDDKDGLTLDAYARIIALSSGGQDMLAMVESIGLTWARFERAQVAWNIAMSADVSRHLTTRFGQLYAAYSDRRCRAATPERGHDHGGGLVATAACAAPHDAPARPRGAGVIGWFRTLFGLA